MSPDVRRRVELVRRVEQLDGVADVFAEASPRLRRMVPFDAAAWVSTDPATGLPTAPTRIENMDEAEPAQCLAFWRREHLSGDVNLFRDLARADSPAAALRHEIGDPAGSGRYREFVEPLGFDDELRVVLRAGDNPWANVTLLRRRGEPPFTPEETDLVASLAEPLGEAIRRQARPEGRAPAAAVPGRPRRLDRPGLLLFDRAGGLVSTNEDARAWLAELPPTRALPSDLGVGVPLWMAALVFRARALLDEYGGGTARARIRTSSGAWLVCHGSGLRTADGAADTTVVVLEPAKAAEIAPIIVQAYDLSERERQVTRLIARGLSTADIADELFLSPHTVRDHVKAVLHKVEVSSRGELVAKLFAEHYWPDHGSDVVRVDDS
jgi:DNA-binding CsgD family transcriptional regulator